MLENERLLILPNYASKLVAHTFVDYVVAHLCISGLQVAYIILHPTGTQLNTVLFSVYILLRYDPAFRTLLYACVSVYCVHSHV